MKQSEYEQGTKIGIRIDLPNPDGGCGQANGISMILCKECSEGLGIINSREYHSYTYSRSSLKIAIQKVKTKIVDMLLKKEWWTD